MNPGFALEQVRSDLVLAARGLSRRPGFALAAVLTLALAIGANTAVFSVVDAVVLRPLPFPEPHRISFLTREGDVSIPDGVDWRAQTRTFEEIALFLRQWNLDLTGEGDPARIYAAVVESSYFRILPTAPVLGRALAAEDDRVGTEPVAVLSESFWKGRFGGDPKILGRTIVLSGQPTRVVGVMPAAFDFQGDDVDLWAPVATTVPWALAERGTNNFDAIGRLRPGVSMAAARAEMVAITTRLAAEYPKTNRGKIVEPMPMHDFVTGPVRPALLVLLGAVLLVALAASASVAALLLARHVARGSEYAVRLALGAGSRHVVGQVLAESLVLAVAGGGLGVALAAWGRDALLALAPSSLPRAASVALDARVLAFTLGLALLAALLAAALPATLAVRTAPGALVAGAGRGAIGGGATGRALSMLVIGEVALASVLLVGSLLLVRSFLRLRSVPLGFEPRGILTADVVLPESRYATRPPQTRAVTEIVRRLASAPGVETAAWVTTPPLEPRGGLGGTILIEGRTYTVDAQPSARVRFVHGDYFGAARIPVVRGRAFTREDDGKTPVAIVNESFARLHWPQGNPIGQHIAFRDFGDASGPYWMTIVGVASDIKGRALAMADQVCVYAPFLQRRIDWNRWGTVVVRASGEPAALVPAVRAAVSAADPDVPLQDVQTLRDKVARAAAPQRFNARVVSAFGLVALFLALQGLFGLLAFTVERSRREIGVRLSLGAAPRDVVRLVAGRGLALVAAGLALGLPAGYALARAASSVLFGVAPGDPATYALAGAALASAAALACLLPARRAARLDPSAILREP
jgi:putative ABC transport system permease protein